MTVQFRKRTMKMKLSFVIGIYLTNIVMRSSVGFKNDNAVVLLILVFWALYMRYIRKKDVITIIDVRSRSKSTIGPSISGNPLINTPVTTRSTTPSTTTPVIELSMACLPNYTLYEGPGRRFCYRYYPLCRSWDDAKIACQADGTDLAILDDRSLPVFGNLMNAIFQAPPRICSPTFGIWLDAKTRVSDFVAEYSDGTTISPDNPLWESGHFFIGNQCVEYATNVNDQRIIRIAHAPCQFEAAYVCQQRR